MGSCLSSVCPMLISQKLSQIGSIKSLLKINRKSGSAIRNPSLEHHQPEVEIWRKCECARKNRRYLRNGSSDPLHDCSKVPGFRDRRIEWHYFRFDQIQDGNRPPSWKILNGHISATCHPIDFVFGSREGFSVSVG